MIHNRDKQLSEARFHRLFDDTQAMSIQGYRADGTVVYWNAASEKIYGYSSSEALGNSLYDLIIPHDQRTEVQQAVAWMFEHKQGIPPARLNLKHKDGSTVPVYSSHTVVALPGDEPIMFCMDADMRALEIAEAEVQRLSYYDPLTNLPNRRLLLERIASMMRNGNNERSVAALLIVDIDNFHSINESLGYSSGDRVLVHCATCLQRFIASADDLARLGKDEFVVLLPYSASTFDAAAAEAERLAAQLLDKLKTPLMLEGNTHQFKACIGITLFHHPGNQAGDELVRQADIALKTAKQSNTTAISFFDQKMEAIVKERLQLSQALNHAVENQELALALQPQVDTQQQVIGFEALLRWQHPKFGSVSPSRFIAIAEASGSIVEIGDWVLQQCCEKLVQWQQTGRKSLTISVNVSSVQFRRGDFLSRVQHILEHTGANPNHLRFELTESLIADDIDFIVAQMEALRALGLSISLDDFGTGYASLAYLTQLPLDELKIDRAFVNDLDKHSKGELLTETIISLGRSMNLAVIAEGVETQEQFKRLQAMGCEYFQGYLFGKPRIEPDEF
ncbi:bifunctional diguanylate cyclase/phosphodiesterase [Idiomarina sp. OT37-5b]|uniref:putative bifunctional diguanylate cyclase/phosphodiesterase n=1 Tax=Idiomarina sp. OT37-5b TaxID=2100422 RepID=UPI000CF9CBF1|nr:GGDEF domain-containing phosphodiesterase [Idiomarina sp. OT37-5b]AVJ55897.1 bifunctional diguanylate cyclase/phosphodiesterase [Idiomarina sp. OT37-5b]